MVRRAAVFLAVPIAVLSAALLPGDGPAAGPVRYAVIDRSGWLGDAVRRHVAATDVARFLDALERAVPSDPLLAEAVGARGSFEARAAQLIQTLAAEAGRLRSPGPLDERFAQWWMEHPDIVLETAPDVSFARFAEVHPARPLARADGVDGLLADGGLDGYFVIPDDSVGTGEAPRYVGSRSPERDVEAWYVELAADLIERQRIAEEGAAP